MPSFAMLLVWRDMFNPDFGLINNLPGLDVNWFGELWTARFAILLTQFWLGYPYMFLVCPGALQSIPADLTEAAAVDGAKPLPGVPGDGLPAAAGFGGAATDLVVRVQLQQLQRVQLTTAGGPFPADNPRPAARTCWSATPIVSPSVRRVRSTASPRPCRSSSS